MTEDQRNNLRKLARSSRDQANRDQFWQLLKDSHGPMLALYNEMEQNYEEGASQENPQSIVIAINLDAAALVLNALNWILSEIQQENPDHTEDSGPVQET